MGDPRSERTDIECALLWKLARSHGWSRRIAVSDLVSDATVTDERSARDVARNRLASRDFVRYHRGTDRIWLAGPPGDAIPYHLRDVCGYAELQIEATFDSYFDGF